MLHDRLEDAARAALADPSLAPDELTTQRYQRALQERRPAALRAALEAESRTARGRLRDLADDVIITWEDTLAGSPPLRGLALTAAALLGTLSAPWLAHLLRAPVVQTLDGAPTGADGVEVQLQILVGYPNGESGRLDFTAPPPLEPGSRVRPEVATWTFRSASTQEASAVAWAVPRIAWELPLVGLDVPVWGQPEQLLSVGARADGDRVQRADPLTFPLGEEGLELVVAVGPYALLSELPRSPADRAALLEALEESGAAVYRTRLVAR